MICDIYDINGEPYKGDPRVVLKRMIKKAKDMGFDHFYTGPELEFFIFKSSEKPETLDVGGYFDLTPLDLASDMRKDIIFALQEMGIPVEYSHHEVGPSQHEIDLVYQDALTMADFTMMYRLVVKEVAMKHGYYATFMPKPLCLDNASGMHVHVSIWRGKENAMYDENDDYAEISQIGRYFIGGLLEHARALTAICCPTVNSYKRLVPGFEAPIYIMWSRRNRSALVRVPVYYKGRKYSAYKRVEFRSADPSCNTYLAFSCILMAGLDGIKRKIDPGDPVDEDVYKLTPERRRALGIGELPTTLRDALEEMKSDEVIHRTLGSHIFDAFIEYKMQDWNQYCLYVTPWEIMKYLDY